MVDSMNLVDDRMQVVNHLQRDQKTLEFKGKTHEEENCRNNKRKKTQRKRKCKNNSWQKRRERRWARLKRRIRTNSGPISMFEVEVSSMAEPVSTKKKKKTEPLRTVITIHSFQTPEVELRFSWFTEFFIYAGFWG